MNPSASTWTPSASASSWTPGGGASTSAPAPAPAPEPTPPPPPPQQSTSNVDSEMDENDPLWQAVLKICDGDTERANKLINNPEGLLQYPEIEAIIAAGAAEGDDGNWEDKADVDEEMEEVVYKAEKMDIKDDASKKSDVKMEEVGECAQEQKEEAVTALEGDPREHINIVFIGHVDAGKSTLSGNILVLTDNVDKRTIEKYEREAKERNRESWFLAFIMDTNEDERAKGITVEVGRAHFETEAKRFTILDAPGHKNYIPNMIVGASQADIGILVISARKGEFEAGFDKGGQSREHAMLAKTLGVSFLIVVINKMDDPTVNWDKNRFDECVSKLKPFLKGCGFTIKKEVKFLPISGLNGANVKVQVDPKDCPWWSKCVAKSENNTNIPTLFELLDQLELKDRHPEAALRIPVIDRYTDRGIIAMGKVESGTARPGQKIMLMPTRNTYKIDTIWANEQPVKCARPGENILLKISGGCGLDDVQKGYVICTQPACRAVNKFICQLYILDLPEDARIFTAGFNAVCHVATCEQECTVTKLFETTNNRGVVNKKARFASIGMKTTCMLEFERTIPCEVFDDMPFLGRLTLRTEGKTVAIGKVVKLPPKKDD